MTRAEVISANPLLSVCQDRYGMRFRRVGAEFYTSCPFHADGKRGNFRVNQEKQLWTCDVCGGGGGTVIDLVVRKEGVDVAKAFELLGGMNGNGNGANGKVEVCRYSYQDENGKELFQVVRYSLPGGGKTFRQVHKVDGREVWSMEGVRRVLYRLPKLLRNVALPVLVVEGEKDADTLASLGFESTCNVGGAGKWLDAYSDALKGRQCYVWPDRDDPGRRHGEAVVKSLAGKAQRTYVVEVEEKDASDWIKARGAKAAEELFAFLGTLKPVEAEANVPIKCMAELEESYVEFVSHSDAKAVNLGAWLPTLGRKVRPLVPGEVVMVVSDTGVGKTAICQNLAAAVRPLPVLLFEVELPESLVYERMVQMDEGREGADVWSEFKNGRVVARSYERLRHIWVCTQSRMDPLELDRIVNQAELKMGRRPALVIVDYAQLVRGKGQSRYDRASDVAESMKVTAKSAGVVLMFASQVQRGKREDESDPVTLHSAKESGSFENSSGLILGAWRVDGGDMKLKCLKNTRGRAGWEVDCRFDGATMRITEKTITQDDIQNTR